MRQIKFRAWDVHRGHGMSSSFGVGQDTIFFDDGHTERPDFVLHDFMQFTGLKDMGGVEVYEGDIVEFTYWWFDGNPTESTLTGLIVYSDEQMSFQLKGVKNQEWERHTGYENDSDYLTAFSELNFEEADFLVKGNVYQNPELMESEK